MANNIIATFLWQSTMLQGIERYLKQAIVDKNASVSSASLVSALVSYVLLQCAHISHTPLFQLPYGSSPS